MSDDIIADIEHREGDGAVTNDSVDGGGRTQYGISERANPAAWADGKVTEAEARVIYEQKYVIGPGFDRISDPLLRAQLVDFGVNSGSGIAIKYLQNVLDVERDAVLGPATLEALRTYVPVRTSVNNALVAARIQMIGKLVQKNPTQLKFLGGWLSRALEFLE